MGNRERGNARSPRMIERPDLELAGVRVYDPAKVGKDAGELIGESPTGIHCTDDADALLALGADCVNYNGLGTTLADPFGRPSTICVTS